MIDAGGYNVDSMAPPWGPQWLRMDPFVFAPTLDREQHPGVDRGRQRSAHAPDVNIPVPARRGPAGQWCAAGGAGAGEHRAFQVRMMPWVRKMSSYSFPPAGLHAWTNWQDEAYRMIPDMSANIG